MTSNEDVLMIVREFANMLAAKLGEKLSDVILYGSYARGDFNKSSDIDVLVILDMEQDSIEKLRKPICQIAIEADWNYDTFIVPTLSGRSEFERFGDTSAFYRNIAREGVRMLA